APVHRVPDSPRRARALPAPPARDHRLAGAPADARPPRPGAAPIGSVALPLRSDVRADTRAGRLLGAAPAHLGADPRGAGRAQHGTRRGRGPPHGQGVTLGDARGDPAGLPPRDARRPARPRGLYPVQARLNGGGCTAFARKGDPMRVLVTGAASGIGHATCVRLARDARAAGGVAWVAAVDVASLDALVKELRELGADALPIRGDMGTPDGPGRAVAEAVQHFGGLDGLVRNARITRPGPLREYAVEDWDRLFAVNTRATWLLAKAAHPALRDAGGAIVAVGSMSGSHVHAGLGAYGPSKAAVIMLVRVLAQELGPDGIRVNAVSPGMTRTGRTARVYADARVAAERGAL